MYKILHTYQKLSDLQVHCRPLIRRSQYHKSVATILSSYRMESHSKPYTRLVEWNPVKQLLGYPEYEFVLITLNQPIRDNSLFEDLWNSGTHGQSFTHLFINSIF